MSVMDPDLERDLRETLDTVIITGNNHSGRKLHIPDPDTNVEERKSLCEFSDRFKVVDRQTGETSVLEKPVDVYPVGYRDFCSTCVSKHWEREADK